MRIRQVFSTELRLVWHLLGSAAMFGCLGWGSLATAVSPAIITQGRQLFVQEWKTQNPSFGGDGLGPLFNGVSCLACHHQGGLGGGGGAPFNSKVIGIEEMQITGGHVTNDVVNRMVSGFHPGFVGSQGVFRNTFDLSHHGGSLGFDQARQRLVGQVPAVFSKNGGAQNASEVRHANATPILYAANTGVHRVMIRARLFQRNTTALYGAGLIDHVPGKQLRGHRDMLCGTTLRDRDDEAD